MPHTPISTKSVLSGKEQRIFQFDNGYGASVIREEHDYDEELFELAVIDRSGLLTCATPVADDVVRWLDEAGVQSLLDLIAALPGA